MDEWLNSDKGFHIMRDHPWHRTEILGGMWGIKKGVIPNLKKLLDERSKGDWYDTDQAFLREEVYPLITNNSMVHDEFFEKKPFPTPRHKLEFVGQVFDYKENTVEEHTEALHKAQSILDGVIKYKGNQQIKGIS